MNRRPIRKKLITGAAAASVPVYLLTREENDQHRAIEVLEKRRLELKDSVFHELNQLINGLEFDVELTRCPDAEIESWLHEGERLMMSCEIPSVDALGYMAVDLVGSHQLADLCLGGRINPNTKNGGELTMSERRIAQRIFLRLSRGLEAVFAKSHSAQPPEVIKQNRAPARFSCVGYKVEMKLENEVIAWYIWVPVALVTKLSYAQVAYEPQQLLLTEPVWQGVPVIGRVVLAEKQVNIKQLQRLLQGQFLPISINQDSATFRLGEQILFSGKVAHEDGKLAFQIN